MPRRAVFLDRDGVLNEPVVRDGKPYPPESLEDVVLCPGATDALASLRNAGFALICVTNQPDVARGTVARSTVDAINERISTALQLDEVLVCAHDDADGCACRKPLPGLVLEGAHRYDIDVAASYLVGDRWRDIEAGDAAGCRTVLVDRGYAERAPRREPDVRVGSVVEAAHWILSDARSSSMHATDTKPQPVTVAELSVKLFADGADIAGIRKLAADPNIKGFTTNPTLMNKAGITDYARFGREVLDVIGDRPISFEVFADEPKEMVRQGRLIASWGPNVNVKIPVTDTKGTPCEAVVRELTAEGAKLNVTALMTEAQVHDVCAWVTGTAGAYISVFAGRVADTGRDPIPMMERSARACAAVPNCELIWASPRELLNVFQANAAGVHVITATHDILAKLSLVGKDLDAYSLETVLMFHRDATAAGFSL